MHWQVALAHLGALAAAGASQDKDDLDLGLLGCHACFAQINALHAHFSTQPHSHNPVKSMRPR